MKFPSRVGNALQNWREVAFDARIRRKDTYRLLKVDGANLLQLPPHRYPARSRIYGHAVYEDGESVGSLRQVSAPSCDSTEPRAPFARLFVVTSASAGHQCSDQRQGLLRPHLLATMAASRPDNELVAKRLTTPICDAFRPRLCMWEATRIAEKPNPEARKRASQDQQPVIGQDRRDSRSARDGIKSGL